MKKKVCGLLTGLILSAIFLGSDSAASAEEKGSYSERLKRYQEKVPYRIE